MKVSVNLIRNLYVDDCDYMARTEDDMLALLLLKLL